MPVNVSQMPSRKTKHQKMTSLQHIMSFTPGCICTQRGMPWNDMSCGLPSCPCWLLPHENKSLSEITWGKKIKNPGEIRKNQMQLDYSIQLSLYTLSKAPRFSNDAGNKQKKTSWVSMRHVRTMAAQWREPQLSCKTSKEIGCLDAASSTSNWIRVGVAVDFRSSIRLQNVLETKKKLKVVGNWRRSLWRVFGLHSNFMK